MAPSDRDIWTAANEVIKANDDPLLHVVMRYDALLKEGDMAGCRVWRRIGAPSGVRFASNAVHFATCLQVVRKRLG